MAGRADRTQLREGIEESVKSTPKEVVDSLKDGIIKKKGPSKGYVKSFHQKKGGRKTKSKKKLFTRRRKRKKPDDGMDISDDKSGIPPSKKRKRSDGEAVHV